MSENKVIRTILDLRDSGQFWTLQNKEHRIYTGLLLLLLL
jgi:hypothetical protein